MRLVVKRSNPDIAGQLDATQYLHHTGDMEKSGAIVALGALAQEPRLDMFRLPVQAGAESSVLETLG